MTVEYLQEWEEVLRQAKEQIVIHTYGDLLLVVNAELEALREEIATLRTSLARHLEEKEELKRLLQRERLRLDALLER